MALAEHTPVGTILKRTRTHYGKSIEEIESALRIRAEQLVALEDDDVAKLPARVYAIGFVKSYADYLRLDGDKIVELFKQQSADKAAKPELAFPVAASDSKAPPVWIALVCFVIFLALAGGWLGLKQVSSLADTAVPQVPETLRTELAEPKPEAKPEPAAAITPNIETPRGVSLIARENSWIAIYDTSEDREILSRVLQAGEPYFVPNRPNFVMHIGNPTAIDIKIEGEIFSFPDGDTLQSIPLNATQLKQRLKSTDNSAIE